ncbi:putative dna repair and recombination protein rad54 [Diaporthe ampelina]|uniref:Putative dna repair and recombination protein rad54 n=1 Tax=Diaporthe ampelina TaxID=1214573 RepID=A0A0G2F5D2_9PEZI|nr:putative dna repair and recombination protein rad54 [Diaporthe ampelina]
MAGSNTEAIRQLSVELKRAASLLDEPEALETGSVTSYISEQFVSGTGLLDLKSKGKEPSVPAINDEEGSRDEGDIDGEYEELPLDDSSDNESYDEDDDYDDTIILEWLNSKKTRAYITAKYEPDHLDNVPGLRPDVVPYDHQAAGASIIKDSLDSPRQGIIIGDLPGLGKTLQVLMAVASTREPGDGPCVVVCPTSCVSQWKQEAAKFFYESNMKTIVLTGEAVSPVELFKYQLVVTSYSQVVSELVRYRKFFKDMKDYTPGAKLPKRPTLTLLSAIFTFSTKLMGKMLVLDEAQLIKNPKSRSFSTMSVLREYFQSCVMLTGTPLDNTWKDAFSLLKLLRDHPIFTPRTMIHAFVLPGTKKKHGSRPVSTRLVRFVQALDATMLRRPQDTIQALLPTITTDVVQFIMQPADIHNSNEKFDMYLKWQHMSKKKKGKMSAKARAEEKNAGFGALISATHWTNHPSLRDILHFEKEAMKKSMYADEPADNLDLSVHDQEYLQAWRGEIAKNRNWRSPRVDIILDTVNRHRDWRPDDAFVIMDESVFFLDILEIALSNMFDPIPCFRFDGRSHPAKRAIILDKFRETPGAKALLASRGTGGVGLNLQHANVLIICGPWWKKSWEDQAVGRIYRAGQAKPVFVYMIEARGFGTGRFKHCGVERFKMKKRDEKNKLNTKILEGITRKDDEEPPERRCF